MTPFTRYAIYFTCPPGPLAERGADWLGWDVATGTARDQDADLATLTETPRKYGFHGTLKPPMRLAEGRTASELMAAARDLAARHTPFTIDLGVTALGRFLALTPVTPSDPLQTLASACVTELDPFRAPPTEAELAKRRKARLTPEQENNLVAWGYPYVHDAFRFHMTLTGPLDDAARQDAQSLATSHFAPALTAPAPVDAITLCGERPDGRFQEIERIVLSG
ncbi:MAG: DUF1045 domain-containing protein [Pseudomonadota bacterium]